MNNPTDEQVKEFWEWCGFKHDVPFPELAKRKDILNPERFTKEQWYIPGAYCGSVPDIDLNNLFKYAVPKLLGYCLFKQGKNHVAMAIPFKGDSGICDNGETPTLALFWAIWEIIKGGIY